MTSSARLPSPARAGPSRTRHRRLITHDGAKGGAARRHAPILGSNGDDVRTASSSSSSSSSSCPPDVRANLSARYADAVRRAADDPFVPYENANGIVNLAECSTTLTNRGGTPGGGGWDDPPEGTPEELTRATIAEPVVVKREGTSHRSQSLILLPRGESAVRENRKRKTQKRRNAD